MDLGPTNIAFFTPLKITKFGFPEFRGQETFSRFWLALYIN